MQNRIKLMNLASSHYGIYPNSFGLNGSHSVECSVQASIKSPILSKHMAETKTDNANVLINVCLELLLSLSIECLPLSYNSSLNTMHASLPRSWRSPTLFDSIFQSNFFLLMLLYCIIEKSLSKCRTSTSIVHLSIFIVFILRPYRQTSKFEVVQKRFFVFVFYFVLICLFEILFLIKDFIFRQV